MLWFILFLIVIGILAYHRASMVVWSISFLVFFLLLTRFSDAGVVSLTVMWVGFLVIAIPLNIPFIRRRFLTKPIFAMYRKAMPAMSRTEKEALEAGSVGWEGELFTGKPNWKQLLGYSTSTLNAEEQAFVDGPVETLCRMIDDWDITHNRFDLPPEMWKFIKENGFFGMIIPKKYGGKEFSAMTHSAVLVKIAGRSISVSSVVSVPNSLGPAELLLKYGTEKQKDYYLPRLAKGEEIPCFALTGPEAGSDASAIPDYGVVCRGEFEGKEILGIRLNWDKRYITLAPIATVLGLAFKLYDPDHLMGSKDEWGITCALIPTKTPGVVTGRRHFPLNCAFPNGPTQGKDVFIPLEWIIGGQKMAGQGWRMLVECLSVGRAISLPSSVIGGAKVGAYATGAYARIRSQFNTPIGFFEGVEEALTRIVGYTYIMDATRVMTVSAIDCGEEPSVPSAISKYHTTEMGRRVVMDAMDIHGGKGICLGPRNYIGRGYQEMPISITVEGANILTRSMIIFGQGAIRCHPFVLQEMEAALESDRHKALAQFDKALFGHMGFMFSNMMRTFLLGITHGYLAGVPKHPRRRYFRQLTRFSSAFALVSDAAMLILGGELKRREKLSGRLGDVLSMLYMTCAVLKHFEDQGQPKADLPLLDWACQTLLFQAREQLHEILRNFPSRTVGGLLRILVLPLGRRLSEPSDKLGHKVARLVLEPTETRDRLVEGAYLTPDKENPVGRMEEVLKKAIIAESIEKRLRKAIRNKQVSGITLEEQMAAAIEGNVLTKEECKQLQEAVTARREVIAVDNFAHDELKCTGS